MSTLHTRGHRPANGSRARSRSAWRDAWGSTRGSRGWTDDQLREMDDDLIWWADSIFARRYEADPLTQAKCDRVNVREIRRGGVPF